MESPSTPDLDRRGPEAGDERDARSLSLLRATVESTRDGILVVDRNGRIALHNQRFCELWGLPVEGSLTNRDQRLLSSVLPRLVDPAGFLERVAVLYANPEAESHDEVRFKDGRILERFSRPQRLGHEVVGRVWSFRDVTAQKRAVEQGERARSLLRAIVESIHDGILAVDMEGRTRVYNRRFAEMWKIPSSEPPLPRMELRDLAAPLLEDPGAFRRRVEQINGAPLEESHDVLHLADGRILERFSRPQRVGAECVGRVWTFRDVTERERLLEQALFLSDSSRLLSSLEAEQAAEAVANRALPLLGDLCVLDLLPEDGPPRRLFAVTLDPEPPRLGDPSPAALAGSLDRFEREGRGYLAVPLRTRDATLGVLTFRARPGRRHGRDDALLASELAQRMSLSFDNARLFRQAKEALQIRDEFLSVAAHELRGPATALKLVFHGLTQPLPDVQRARLLQLAERQVRHVARFVDELLDISRLRGEQMHLELEEVDLAAVAREVVARMGPEIAQAGSTLTVRAADPVVGRWDRLRLEQLVNNLLGNALKFGRGRPITLSARVEDGKALLRISDQGIGIPAGHREAIFQAFERAASPRHYGGLGLGLYISKSIVTALGGTISAESEEGRGATFTATLPRAEGGSR
jgi:PAS domain S-box-containing protein